MQELAEYGVLDNFVCIGKVKPIGEQLTKVHKKERYLAGKNKINGLLITHSITKHWLNSKIRLKIFLFIEVAVVKQNRFQIPGHIFKRKYEKHNISGKNSESK